MRRAAAALGLAFLVAGVGLLIWGQSGALPAATFGGLAAAIHTVAARLLEPALEPPFEHVMSRWAAGFALRLAGAALLGAAVILRPETFTLLPAVAGFLGVLVPLMAGEMHFVMRKLRKRT